jgi:hypothetical protein
MNVKKPAGWLDDEPAMIPDPGTGLFAEIPVALSTAVFS